MKLEILSRGKKEKIVEKLKERFGISKIPYLLIRTGKGKIRAFSGNLSREELSSLCNLINVEVIGMHLATIKQDEIRMSFDALNIDIFKKQITKNIIEINKKQLERWLRGVSLEVKSKNKKADKLI